MAWSEEISSEHAPWFRRERAVLVEALNIGGRAVSLGRQRHAEKRGRFGAHRGVRKIAEANRVETMGGTRAAQTLASSGKLGL